MRYGTRARAERCEGETIMKVVVTRANARRSLREGARVACRRHLLGKLS